MRGFFFAGKQSATSSPTAEDTVTVARAKLESLEKDSISFRLLDALLTHAPTVEGLNIIISDIVTASAETNGLNQLAEFYKTGLFLPMNSGGQTSMVSFDPSRDQIQVDANSVAEDLEIAKSDPVTLKKYVLYRDGYRCVLTHEWDFTYFSRSNEKAKLAAATPLVVPIDAAHILPFFLTGVDNEKLFGKCSIWSIITSFTNIKFNELRGNNINTLMNTITLDATAHRFFGELYVWFEAVPGRINTYKVRKANEYIFHYMYPLPDPRHLALHATVAKVVHEAGINMHLNDIVEKYQSVRVLSDESGLEYLDGLLRVVQTSC